MSVAEQSSSAGERVQEVLDAAESHLAARAADEDSAQDDDLDDIAGQAAELLSETDPGQLLAAIGPDDTRPDEEPSSLPEAMANSDPETVVTLRKLVTLSKLDAEADGDDRERYIERLRELSADDSNDQSSEVAGEDTEGGQPEGDEDSEPGSDEGEGDDYAERLRDELEDGIDEFRDGIQSMRSELSDESESEGDEGDDGSRPEPGQGTMFSTVPSRNRADLRDRTRLSTVRNNRTEDG